MAHHGIQDEDQILHHLSEGELSEGAYGRDNIYPNDDLEEDELSVDDPCVDVDSFHLCMGATGHLDTEHVQQTPTCPAITTLAPCGSQDLPVVGISVAAPLQHTAIITVPRELPSEVPTQHQEIATPTESAATLPVPKDLEPACNRY